MTSRFTEIVDGHDLRTLADFWCAVLDYQIIDQKEDGEIEIGPAEYAEAWSDEFVAEWKAKVRAASPVPTIVFVPVPERKTVKNRVHIDVSPIASHEQEVERLLALGATKADIGQGDVRWVVMRDPEGNEFCVLRGVEA